VVLTKEKIEILQSIQFEKNQDVIQAESEPILRAVAGILSGHPDLTMVRIEGHTDSQGSAVRNTLLSEKRAQAVRRWLMEKGGIAGARLEARGYGPTQPVAPNKTAAGRSKNRRVEFRIVDQ
jgi:outer membrane protein OmpA-like peptidoglycan-associated protein